MGLTLVDAGVLIGFLDGDDVHHDAADRQFALALERGDRISIPASALAESLVAPFRAGQAAVDTVLDTVARLPLHVEDLDTETSVIAAGLRESHGRGLPLPDALVVATAIHLKAAVLVTTDRRWPTALALGLPGALSVI
jgi:predicted nucleic acid-binding protein